jgi:hypothetical protein
MEMKDYYNKTYKNNKNDSKPKRKIQLSKECNTSLWSDTGWELSNKSEDHKVFVRTLTFPCPAWCGYEKEPCRVLELCTDSPWKFCHNKKKAKCGNVTLVKKEKIISSKNNLNSYPSIDEMEKMSHRDLLKFSGGIEKNEQDILTIRENFKKTDCEHFRRLKNKEQNKKQMMVKLLLLIGFGLLSTPFLLGFFIMCVCCLKNYVSR